MVVQEGTSGRSSDFRISLLPTPSRGVRFTPVAPVGFVPDHSGGAVMALTIFPLGYLSSHLSVQIQQNAAILGP